MIVFSTNFSTVIYVQILYVINFHELRIYPHNYYVDNNICYHGKAFYTSKQHAIVMHEYYVYTTCIANVANDS